MTVYIVLAEVKMLKLLLLLTGLTVVSCRQFYRKDYEYNNEFGAFYKIHWDPKVLTWNSALLVCDNEEAKLFYPKQPGEWRIVKNLMSITSMSVKPNFTDILVGIHDEIGFGEYITVDGHLTSCLIHDDQNIPNSKRCVTMDIENGTYEVKLCSTDSSTDVRPFVCKKVDESPCNKCPTIDHGYKYLPELDKCYKVHNRERTWRDAMHTCLMEGGKLTVPENETERRYLWHVIEPNRDHFIGFFKSEQSLEFYTITGQKVVMSDHLWKDLNNDSKENCGVFYRADRLYNKSQNCEKPLPFVCQMAPRSQNT